ncbi:MAG: oligosaccharide flippase family protein [Phycisphaeraceae bacterium]|nr:oligosaccharide flippase family protein [Phycisphaeraceae bacterium]MBX3406550.1 oligosaccharide flippase family protein [Phycisphaeraceae bacterium]
MPPAGAPTTPVPPTPADDGAAASRGFGRRAAVGFMLMSLQSMATRGLIFAAQIALAAILLPDDFGLAAIAMTVGAFAALVQQLGTREVLVSRQHRFGAWEAAAHRAAIGAGVLIGALVALAGPVLAAVYGDARLVGLVAVIALSAPINGVSIVHEARLQADLRFKALAGLNLLQGSLQPLLAIVFALLGFGAYAFVLPRTITAFARAAYLLPLVTIRTGGRRARRWRAIASLGTPAFATNIMHTLGAAAPAAALGLFAEKAVVGFFAFAFNIAVQSVLMFAQTLDSILFPTLGRLRNEPTRQRDAVLRSARALAASIVPVCALQAVGAPAVLDLLFIDKWDDAALPTQILSAGMVFFALYIPAGSLLQAHGRFRDRLVIASIWNIALAVFAVPASALHGVPGLCAVMAACYAGGAAHIWIAAIRPLGGGAADALRVAAPSLAIGLIAAAAGFAADRFASGAPLSGRWLAFARCAAIGIAVALMYTLLLRFAMPRTWNDLLFGLTPITSRLPLAARFLTPQQSPMGAP